MNIKLLEYQMQLYLVQVLLRKQLVTQAEYHSITLKLKKKYKKLQSLYERADKMS